jgi:hypothetical protein
MNTVVVGIAGACLGVLAASSRVPRVRWVPLTGVGLLIIAAVVVMAQLTQLSPLSAALIFIVTFEIGSVFYAGALWLRSRIGQDVTYWGWVWRDFIHPRYVRRVYQEADATQGRNGGDLAPAGTPDASQPGM